MYLQYLKLMCMHCKVWMCVILKSRGLRVVRKTPKIVHLKNVLVLIVSNYLISSIK